MAVFKIDIWSEFQQKPDIWHVLLSYFAFVVYVAEIDWETITRTIRIS